jgi:hypothetical protein
MVEGLPGRLGAAKGASFFNAAGEQLARDLLPSCNWNEAIEAGGVMVGNEVEIALDIEASPES